MTFRRISAGLAVAAAAVAGLCAQERNAWPLWVDQPGDAPGWSGAGPFLYRDPTPNGGTASGFRPFVLRWETAPGQTKETAVLYPLFFYRTYGDSYHWSVFELINRTGRRAEAPAAAPAEAEAFDVWPFYFSRSSPDPADSYRAVFPVAGTIKGRFTYARLTFVLFPFYLRTEKHGATTVSAPWPFLRVTSGAESGFALWPFYVRSDRPGAWSRRFYLWPLVWTSTTQAGPEAPPGTAPTRSTGFLPFYAGVEGPGLVSENYLWPFFGYTDRTAPTHYHETRYFWPLFVQGRGDRVTRNRWGPFYTHSVAKGLDKTWAPWPLYRHLAWQNGGLDESKSQLFYFLYWRGEERRTGHPEVAPAYKVHYWPFATVWDNGAGRRQWQVLSPFEVFFENNREMREAYTPFFALYRHEEEPDGGRRTSLLWNAVTWARRPAEGTSEFHLGPVLALHEDRTGRRTWRLFALEFSPHFAIQKETARRP